MKSNRVLYVWVLSACALFLSMQTVSAQSKAAVPTATVYQSPT
jgi:hypothetical protein